jgi:hypothetical protein
MDEIRKRKIYCYKNKLIPDHFGVLPTGVGKCQHLPKWFGKSPKWKRSHAFFRTFTASLWQILGCTGKT